jgi:hypothetical protein
VGYPSEREAYRQGQGSRRMIFRRQAEGLDNRRLSDAGGRLGCRRSGAGRPAARRILRLEAAASGIANRSST